MSILNYLKDLLTGVPKASYKKCEKIILKLGYREEGAGVFVKEASIGRTMIWLSEHSVKIKVYANEYSESDFLSGPLPDKETLISFIRSNEI